jgi:RNA polymerase sigma-70 factor (ECF subfamily)
MDKRKTPLLSALFRQHADALLACVQRRTGMHDAEDIVQDTYLRLLQRDDMDTLREPRAFLYRAAINLSTDYWRKAHVRAGYADLDSEPAEVPDTQPGPESTFESTRRWETLVAALEELPDACRRAFVLNKFEGRNHDEIAAQLGVSAKTVARYIHRAFEHCAQRLDL